MSDGKVVFDITGNLSGINSALNAATNTIARDTAKWTVLGQTAMNALTSAAKAGFNAVKDLALNAFEYNAQMETYAVNFKTLLGSVEAAQTKMVELKNYAVKTPFAFSDLADATQTLLAFQLSSEEASQALKYLGDISLGDANKLSSLTLAFGQVSSAGKLAGQDLLQMINAGFNPLKVIAEETGVAYADLKAVMSGEKTSEDFQLRMKAARKEVEELGTSASEGAIMLAQIGKDGMISADMVAAAMRIATSEGGAFYKALENASTTAQGQISTIKDSWDMLAGKITGGAFDKLSQEVFPKVIQWLDDLNAAYDEKGFDGLKGAAGGIFDELGTLAFNAGAGILAKIYNGITGDTKTSEDIKGYLSEIFGAAGDALAGVRDVGLGVLEWIRDNGELVGGAATSIGVGFGVLLLLTHPLAGALGVLAGAIALLTTDWTAFEEKYPNLVAAFEDITGIEFDDFAASVERAKTNLSAFYNDALAPLFDWLSEHGEAVQLTLAGIGAAMALMGAPVAGIALMAGVVISNWGAIKTAVTNAVDAVGVFFTQTVPESWTNFVTDVKASWNDNVVTPVDNAALKVADFFGVKVPEDWSLCKTIGDAWNSYVSAPVGAAASAVTAFLTQTVPDGWSQFTASIKQSWKDHVNDPIDQSALKIAALFGLTLPENWSLTSEIGKAWDFVIGKIQSAIDKINELLGMLVPQIVTDWQDMSDHYAAPEPFYGFEGWSEHDMAAALDYIKAYAQVRKGNKEYTDMMVNAMKAIHEGQEEDAASFATAVDELFNAIENGEPVQIPAEWMDGTDAELQAALEGMNLSATVQVNPFLNRTTTVSDLMSVLSGLTGQGHASGGLFTSATRFLGADGMHTFGESGTEVLLPLDALWRKLGLTFDQAFSANLDGLQYAIMPPIPAATPAANDQSDLSETIAAAVREAVSGLTVEMDKRTVGRILKPVISQEIADDVNNRRWTS